MFQDDSPIYWKRTKKRPALTSVFGLLHPMLYPQITNGQVTRLKDCRDRQTMNLPEFNPEWYPALIQARKEYLLSRMAEIEQLSPPEALAAMDEFNEADLQLMGLKRIKIKDNK